MSFFVYILASRRNGTLYIGMTDNLARRVWEHETGVVAGFTKKYELRPWFGTRYTSPAKVPSSENGNSRNGIALGRFN